jgi:hypothetical protein
MPLPSAPSAGPAAVRGEARTGDAERVDDALDDRVQERGDVSGGGHGADRGASKAPAQLPGELSLGLSMIYLRVCCPKKRVQAEAIKRLTAIKL